ncbi:hypothetical protein M427DRAFT_54996 [Gonapodya prolifera JEL478]|uniref:UreD-domain-containing protein n=1 Tax=Gonapodya prolifera (strain JEL478) TaxID=1344416 RepID=A0A139AKD1_GONPJ|nr:hypothetical protein M427DRAFT_54996 [Gonapodya prolifera JEL478]|eukprot:KXS16963.1 hypothetical protein M427DRAFT_54996 [Gonapodya prolifera JEL478]
MGDAPVPPGHGRLRTQRNQSGGRCAIPECAGAYPLKLLRVDQRAFEISDSRAFDNGDQTDSKKAAVAVDSAMVYVLTYGGGVVSGDAVSLDVEVGDGTGLVLLSQGSTKIFKRRRDTTDNLSEVAWWTIDCKVNPGGVLVVGMDPVAPFAGSLFRQHLKITLANHTSGVVAIDWVTSGRGTRGERWAFNGYESKVELWLGESSSLWCRESLVLGDESTKKSSAGAVHPTSYSTRLGFDLFECFATIIIAGDPCTRVLEDVEGMWNDVLVGGGGVKDKRVERNEVVWSASPLPRIYAPYRSPKSGEKLEPPAPVPQIPGLVVRVAGKTPEVTRTFVKGTLLRSLDSVVGDWGSKA